MLDTSKLTAPEKDILLTALSNFVVALRTLDDGSVMTHNDFYENGDGHSTLLHTRAMRLLKQLHENKGEQC